MKVLSWKVFRPPGEERAPLAMTFVKFQNPDEVETIGMWKVWSDKPFEGLSRAAIELEDCASSTAVGPEEDLGPQESIRGVNPNDPLMAEFEDSALTPPVFHKYMALNGFVSTIPAESRFNRDQDPYAVGYVGMKSPRASIPVIVNWFNVVEIRFRTSLRSFLLNLEPIPEYGAHVLYQAQIHSKCDGWQTAAVPFESFVPKRGSAELHHNPPLKNTEISRLGVTVLSSDATNVDESFVVGGRDFSLDLQWVRFVRRSADDARAVDEQRRVDCATEDYMEYLKVWKRQAQSLVSRGVIDSIEEVKDFSIHRVHCITSKDDLKDMLVDEASTQKWTMEAKGEQRYTTLDWGTSTETPLFDKNFEKEWRENYEWEPDASEDRYDSWVILSREQKQDVEAKLRIWDEDVEGVPESRE